MVPSKKECIRVLFVDDISLILEGYRRIIEKFPFPGKKIRSCIVADCDAAWEVVKTEAIHLAILDLNFPLGLQIKMESGEVLGMKIRQHYPEIKLIVLTGIVDKERIGNLLQNLNPEGFLIKGETNSQEIFKALQLVLNGKYYYSPSVKVLLKSHLL